MESPDSAPSVVTAVAQVIADLPGIGKAGRNKDQGYNFRGIEQITTELQPILAKHGVFFVPRVLQWDVVEVTINNKPWTDNRLLVEYTVYGPGGVDDCITVGPIAAIGRDNSDKGCNKAMSQAFKYALLQTLCIADAKDDGDQHTHVADEGTSPRRSASSASGGKISAELRDRAMAYLHENPARKDEFVVQFGVRLPAKVDAQHADAVEAFISSTGATASTASSAEGGAGADDATGASPAPAPTFAPGQEPFE